MLSILIPVYNYDIIELVKNLHQQTRSMNYPFEIIVADDCSSFKKITAKNQTLEKWSNCSFFSNKENKGRTYTRNFLAHKAQYEQLLFLDADVLPTSSNFIENFQLSNNVADVVFGGIIYSSTPPEKAKMLRWKYGKSREAKSVEERQKKPYLSLISQSLLIKKTIFLQANNFLDNAYGADALFSQNLENLNAKVKHIDNPVVHYGLENSISYIEKTKKGLKTLANFSNDGKIPINYRPIQEAYLNLKKYKMLPLFSFLMNKMNSAILANLTSRNPSLFLFDLYRLNYYASLNN